MAQHHCFHNDVATISEIFPSAGQVNFLKLIEKLYLNKFYSFNLNIWFSACVNHCHVLVLITHSLTHWIVQVQYRYQKYNLERVLVTLTGHLNNILMLIVN